MIEIEDRIGGSLRGEVEVIALYKGGRYAKLFSGSNSITDASKEVVKGLLAGDFENKMVSTIAVGDGGDCEIAPPHNDTGARVAPDPTETEIRSLVEALPILGRGEVSGKIQYVAIAKPEQANSDDINEIALLTRDGTLVAHFVTEAYPTRARKYPKKSWVYWIIRWKLVYDQV